MRRDAIVAALAGAAGVAGFAPLGLHPLTILALTALLALWYRQPQPRAGALLGFAFGMGHFLVGVSWVYVSLHEFGLMPAPLAAVGTLAFCVILALFPAAVGYVRARWSVAGPIDVILVVPGLWVLFEWLRGWLFTGFPWLYAGYSQIDTPLAGFAPVIGIHGVSFLTVAVAGLAWIVLRPPWTRRIAAIVLAVAIYLIGAGLSRVAWTEPAGEGVDVALLQGNIPQELKFVPGRFESTLAVYSRLVAQTNARLVVLPETAIPRFPEELPPGFLEGLKAHATKTDGDILFGLPVGDPRAKYYNAVVSVGTSPGQVYSKSHLVPFGEFVPPGFGWIVSFLQIPLSDFTAGPTDPKPLALAGERVAVNICYEDAFSSEILRQLPEATLLVNVSNVAWFGDSLAPAQHLQISRMRAIETGRYMLRATNTGVTAIIDEKGNEVATLPLFTEGALTGRVQGFAGSTPYAGLGDRVIAGIAVLTLGALLGAFASRRAGGARRSL